MTEIIKLVKLYLDASDLYDCEHVDKVVVFGKNRDNSECYWLWDTNYFKHGFVNDIKENETCSREDNKCSCHYSWNCKAKDKFGFQHGYWDKKPAY